MALSLLFRLCELIERTFDSLNCFAVPVAPLEVDNVATFRVEEGILREELCCGEIIFAARYVLRRIWRLHQ